MKKYSKYKNTDIDWIGEIPEHWSHAKLKWKSTIYAGGTPSTSEPSYWEGGDIPWLNSGSVNQKVITEPSEYITKKGLEESSAKMVKTGSLLMALAGQGKTKGTVAITKIDTTCNQSLGVIDPGINIVGKYEFYYLESKYKQIRGLAGDSKRDGLNLAILGDIFTPLPRREEQTAIATYLDHKTALIDKLIASNEKQVKLLEEKRKATINQAVTKGLDPNAKMKDSGVKWIGEIPEHWDSIKIRRLTKVARGASPRPIADPKYFDEKGEFAWVRIADVTASERYLKDTTQTLSELGASLSVKMYPNDFFLSIAGSVGKPIITKIKCCIHDGFVYFPNLKINPEFLYYIFTTEQPYKGLGKQGTQLNLNTETVADISIPLPSQQEIEKIVIYLDKQLSKLDGLIKRSKEQNKLLKEYRQALISHVVMGKVDVRDEIK